MDTRNPRPETDRLARRTIAVVLALALAGGSGATAVAADDGAEPDLTVTDEELGAVLADARDAAYAEGLADETTLDVDPAATTDQIGDVVLPEIDGPAISVGDALALSIADATALPSDERLDDGSVVHRGAENDYALATFADGSFRTETVLHGPDSPRDLRFDLHLRDGLRAEIAAEDGGVDVLQDFPGEDDSVLVGRFEAPWAVDADGEPVATWFELRGDDLVQVVDHGPGTAYPVVADPFWIPAVVVALRVATVVLKVGSKTVKYTKAPASRVVNALSSFRTVSFTTGSHTFRLDKSGMKHILERHHPHYWDGTTKSTQTFFNPSMSVADVRSLVHGAMKQWPATLKSKGTNTRIPLSGTYDNVKYSMVIDKGRVVQFYPR